MKTTMQNVVETSRELVDLGIADNKGRPTGVSVVRGECDFVETESDSGYWTRDAGHYYYANVQATRHGIVYGASQSSIFFTSAEDASQHVAARIADTRKRYAKKFAK